MSLDNLVNQIKKETEEEIASLEKESSLLLKEIDQEGEKRLNRLRKEKEEAFLTEKKKAFENHCKEKEFESEMELLRLKNEIMERMTKRIKEKVGNFSKEEKARIFRQELEKVERIVKEDAFIFVPPGKKDELADLFHFPKEKITEKEIGFKDGFVIESGKFIFKADLFELIDRKIAEEKDFFYKLLFAE